MLRVLSVWVLFLVTACNLVSSIERENLPSDNNKSIDSQPEKLSQGEDPDCNTLKRVLNPPEQPALSESELDKYFRLAFASETAGDFEQAIFYYREAAKLSNCDCDTLHAEAGEQAAKEAQELFEQAGMDAQPTQLFWGRLQQLTEDLPCVEIN
ncbi:MAG: hypothetical protein AAF652_06300 [Cyanobacteria bacterium P01_C01_bin.72]